MRRLAVVCLLPLIALAACGGGDDDAAATTTKPAVTTTSAAATTPTTTLPSAAPTTPAAGTGDDKAGYVADSEDVCSDALDVFDELDEAFDGPESGWVTALQKELAQARSVSDDLEELAAGRPDEAELKRTFLTPLREQIKEITAYVPEFAADIKAGKEPGGPSLTKADDRAMKAYGFDDCVDWASSE